MGYVVDFIDMNIKTSPLRLAVFDCDGTLVDSQESIIGAMFAACDHHSLVRPTENAVRRVVGLPLDIAIGRVLDEVDEAFALEISETYKAAFGDLRAQGNVNEPMFDGVAQVLDGLDDQQWLMGIATGKSLRGLKRTLQHHNLMERFVTHQTADSAFGKPHPDMLLKAMAATGAAPEHTVMIGDTTFDVEMANNAGVKVIGVAWGYHEVEELKDAGAFQVAHTADQLSAALMEDCS